MPTYKYQYSDQSGRTREALMMGTSEKDLESKLSNLGYWIVDIKEVPSTITPVTKKTLFTPKIKRRDLIEFCFQLKTQIEAGIPLVDAIAELPRELTNPYLKTIMTQIHTDLQAGFQFHEALSRFPHVFTGDMVSLVEAGVNSGALPKALMEARDHLEWSDRLVSQVRQASIYPMFVVIAIAVFMLTVFTFVVPKFVTLFDKMNVEAPMLTRIVFSVSDIAKQTWWMFLLAGIFIPILLKLGMRLSERFAFFVDQVKLRVPVFGELQTMIALSRFAHNLASLLRSGIPIVRTIQLCQGLVGNRVVSRALKDIEGELQKGKQMSDVLPKYPIFNSLVVRMVRTGEQTGQMDTSLESVSAYYEEIVPQKVKAIFSMIEPAMILFLVGVVGAIALSIFLPIFDLMGMAG